VNSWRRAVENRIKYNHRPRSDGTRLTRVCLSANRRVSRVKTGEFSLTENSIQCNLNLLICAQNLKSAFSKARPIFFVFLVLYVPRLLISRFESETNHTESDIFRHYFHLPKRRPNPLVLKRTQRPQSCYAPVVNGHRRAHTQQQRRTKNSLPTVTRRLLSLSNDCCATRVNVCVCVCVCVRADFSEIHFVCTRNNNIRIGW